jgi:serine/threonine protein kinase
MSHPPDLSSPPDTSLTLVNASEVWDFDDDQFKYWTIIFSNGTDYFYYSYANRQLLKDDKSLLTSLAAQASLVPWTHYKATPPPGLSPSPAKLPDNTYVKTHLPLFIADQNDLSSTRLADSLVQEALIYQELAKHPHPNICEYRGIFVLDGLMSGICLRQYSKTLQQCVDDGDRLDVEPVVQGIETGLKHLHELGFVHVRHVSLKSVSCSLITISQGDITPSNIVFDVANLNVPVIIDFDSCYRDGAEITGKGGTTGWSKQNTSIAKCTDDNWSLEAIKGWLLRLTYNPH